MKQSIARRILSGVSEEQMATLNSAHNRYMHFTGVYSGFLAEIQIIKDRASYPNLLKYTDDGLPLISGECCGAFMNCITGFPVDWCLAFDALNFDCVGDSLGIDEVLDDVDEAGQQ